MTHQTICARCTSRPVELARILGPRQGLAQNGEGVARGGGEFGELVLSLVIGEGLSRGEAVGGAMEAGEVGGHGGPAVGALAVPARSCALPGAGDERERDGLPARRGVAGVRRAEWDASLLHEGEGDEEMIGINKPGFYRDVPEAIYHNDPVVEPSASASLLAKLYSRSPRHAWFGHPKLNPNFEPSNPTPAMAFGSAVHALLTLSCEVKRLDFDDWRGKEARQARDAITAAGNIALLAKDYDNAESMLRTLRRELHGHEVGDVFGEGVGEVTMAWRDDGAWLRGRMDWWSESRNLIVDYKTTTTAEPDAWSRKLFDLGSDFAGVLYPQGVSALTGERPPRFIYIAQEVDPPHAFSVVEMDDQAVEFTTNRVAQAFAVWRECLRTNQWPGYPAQVCHVSPPVYAVKREETRSLAAAASREIIATPV